MPVDEPFFDYYQPDHKLRINPKANMPNKNTPEEINRI